MTPPSWTHVFPVQDLGDGRPLVVSSQNFTEPFNVAWRRSWDASRNQTWAQVTGFDTDDFQLNWFIEGGLHKITGTGSSFTVSEMITFLDGDDAAVLELGWGLGADDPWMVLQSIGELMSVGLTVHGVISLARDGRDVFDASIYRADRRLFDDWRGSEALAPALEQSVRRFREWDDESFRRRFGASPDATSKLLRHLGYEATRSPESGRRVWMERSEQ
jgi:hypothetical protein